MGNDNDNSTISNESTLIMHDGNTILKEKNCNNYKRKNKNKTTSTLKPKNTKPKGNNDDTTTDTSYNWFNDIFKGENNITNPFVPATPPPLPLVMMKPNINDENSHNT